MRCHSRKRNASGSQEIPDSSRRGTGPHLAGLPAILHRWLFQRVQTDFVPSEISAFCTCPHLNLEFSRQKCGSTLNKSQNCGTGRSCPAVAQPLLWGGLPSTLLPRALRSQHSPQLVLALLWEDFLTKRHWEVGREDNRALNVSTCTKFLFEVGRKLKLWVMYTYKLFLHVTVWMCCVYLCACSSWEGS